MGLTYEQALKIAENNNEKVIPTMCGMCGPKDGCGIYAFVKDGVFTRVAGMNECPVNKGAICAKSSAAPQWVYARERITSPLLRVGEKGEGKFKEISWDEAMTILTEKLKEQKEKYGPESLAILSPARRSYSEYMQRFLIAHGSPNYGHSGICFMQRAFCYTYTLGSLIFPDYANADLIIYWGRQPVFSGAATGVCKSFMAAKKRNARTVGVKPSLEADANLMDEWVPIRPGTDAAMALAMINVVIENNKLDYDFVNDWCYGFEELKAHVKKYTPQWAETITGVPASQIEKLALEYATTKSAVIDLGNGIEHSPSSSDLIRAVSILIAITGHLDRKGCNVFPPFVRSTMPCAKDISIHNRYTKEMVDKLVAPEFPKEFQPFLEGTSSAYYRIFESVLTEKPYPVRTIIAAGTQPATSTRGTKNVIEALKKLDFYVVVDPTKTADMDYADLVFPSATPYECDHPFEASQNWLMARNKVIEPLGDYKSIYEFFLELGNRMGYGEDFWHGDVDEWQSDLIEPFGLTVDELREMTTGKCYQPVPDSWMYEKYENVFNRPSMRTEGGKFLPQGKVALYNTLFEEYGYNPLPEWHEGPESLTNKDCAELRERYPLILSDYHTSSTYTASWQRNVKSLRKCAMDPEIHIHPSTAETRGIADGEWVKVESKQGWIKVRAQYYEGIRLDTVMMLHGWWQGCEELGIADLPLMDGGANVNHLYPVTEDAFDPLITAMSSQALVEVSKLE